MWQNFRQLNGLPRSNLPSQGMRVDWTSFFGGILLGVFIGAAGEYFALLFTDRRKEKEAVARWRKQFEKVEAQLPKLIAEMKADFADPENEHVRKAFLLHNKGVHINMAGPSLSYYESEHVNLVGQFTILENYGYAYDDTTTNATRYRLTEEFVDLLRG